MEFNIDIKYSECDIKQGNKVVGTVKFNAYDTDTRSKFYETYNWLCTQEQQVITTETDIHGVPKAYEQITAQAQDLLKELSTRIDDIFGKGTSELLTDDNKDPAILMEFLAFASNEFRVATGLKIQKYTSPTEGAIME